eukprot:510437-Prymnesium_polylepis.1
MRGLSGSNLAKAATSRIAPRAGVAKSPKKLVCLRSRAGRVGSFSGSSVPSTGWVTSVGVGSRATGRDSLVMLG